jgi:hypothetical protein
LTWVGGYICVVSFAYRILIFLFSSLILWANPNSSWADPPEKSLRKGNSFLLNTISKYALIDYSKGLLKNVNKLSESSKDQIIDKSAHGTVAIILYEFATGLGPYTRFFHEEHPFVHELRLGPAMRWTLYTFFENGEKDQRDLRYQFSPLYKPILQSKWPFAVTQHYRTLSEHNLSQFVLGSFNSDVTTYQGKVYVHLWNVTSRKSLFLGLGTRVQRPAPFGNAGQHVYLVFTMDEAISLATSYKH